MGNFIGLLIDEKLAMGRLVMRIITQKDASRLISSLQRKGFGMTYVPAEGARGKVKIIYTVIERGDLDRAIKSIEKYNPNAFYTIEDVRTSSDGVFPARKTLLKRLFPKPPKTVRRLRLYMRLMFHRKGK